MGVIKISYLKIPATLLSNRYDKKRVKSFLKSYYECLWIKGMQSYGVSNLVMQRLYRVLHIKPCKFAYTRLLNKQNENRVTLRGQNISKKCFQSLELLLYFKGGIRSFLRGNIGSVSKRAAKLPAAKL